MKADTHFLIVMGFMFGASVVKLTLGHSVDIYIVGFVLTPLLARIHDK